MQVFIGFSNSNVVPPTEPMQHEFGLEDDNQMLYVLSCLSFWGHLVVEIGELDHASCYIVLKKDCIFAILFT